MNFYQSKTTDGSPRRHWSAGIKPFKWHFKAVFYRDFPVLIPSNLCAWQTPGHLFFVAG